MVTVDRPGVVIAPATSVPVLTSPQTTPASVPVIQVAEAELTAADQNLANTPQAADFAPVEGMNFNKVEGPGPNEPIQGVLKDEQLAQRLDTLKDAAARRLMSATYDRESLTASMSHMGPGVSESMITQVEAYKRANHTVEQLGAMLKVLNGEGGVEALQEHLKDTALNEATGSEMGTDGVYGPNTDEILRERIQNPASTFVPSPTVSLGADAAFVYQEGEVGADGTEMEAQANCGPATMAMIIERLGGDSPSMRELREAVNAPTGTRDGTYGLDTDQVTEGITTTLAEQGITVTTEVNTYNSKQSEDVIASMRERLAAGDDVILLTSNMGSGGSTGHYVVVNDVLADGSFVVHDPQEPDGADTVQTAADLEAAMARRADTDRDTRLISIRRQ